MNKNRKTSIGGDPKDHLANERTFLAWVRTSIGIIALGFVIEKFGFFIQKFSSLTEQHSIKKSLHFERYSSIFGISLVAFGALICLLSFIDYKKVRKQIENDLYQPSNLLNIIITLAVIIVSVCLALAL